MSRLQPSQLALVLFDLDGTLVDTAPDMVGALNQLRVEQGLREAPYSQVRNHVSRGGAGVIRAGWNDARDAPVEKLLPRFLEIYAGRLVERSHLFEGMDKVLEQIEKRGWSWGVVTNKSTDLSEPLLAGLGLRSRMATLVCGDTLPTRKPDPAGIVLACEQAGVAPINSVYIGDDLRDIQAGRAAGCATIAAAYGYISAADQPADWQADRIVSRASQLTEILGLGGLKASV